MYVSEMSSGTNPDIVDQIEGVDIFNSKLLYVMGSKSTNNSEIISSEGRLDLILEKPSIEVFGFNFLYNRIKDLGELTKGSKLYILSEPEIMDIKLKYLM